MLKAFMAAELCVENLGTLTQYVDRAYSSRNAGCGTLDQSPDISAPDRSAARTLFTPDEEIRVIWIS
jgi:hypothetical protein